MAFGTPIYRPIQKQRYFTVNATGGSAANTDSTMIEYLTLSYAFMLDKIHLHLSAVHASVVDFMVYVSHFSNSYYNHDLLSVAMNGVKDVLYRADPDMLFFSGDTIHCSMVYSAANHYGLEISGWAVTVPAEGWK